MLPWIARLRRLAGHPCRPLVLAGAVLVGLVPLALAAHTRWDADYGFVAVVIAQGGVYLLAVRLVPRMPRGAATLAVVLIVAAVLRLPLLFAEPLHSTDVYRYVWDGRVQGAGINPYQFVPGDGALADLRDPEIYPNINRADYAVTIYPPMAQQAFWLFTRVADTLWAVKAGWLLLEALLMLALARLLVGMGRPPAELLLYAWHPLPVWEIACDGHVDAGMAAFLVFALSAWTGRKRLATGALLAASVLFKPLTLAAAPAFWRRWDWRVPLGFAVAAILAYLPYLGVGTGVLGFLPRYLGEEGIESGHGFLILRVASLAFGPLPPHLTLVYLIIGGIVLAALAAVCVADRRQDARTAALQAQILLTAFLVVLSPNYPWYFLVLVPLGCLAPWLPAQLLTLLGVILYSAPPLDALPRTMLVQSILYAVVMAAWVSCRYTQFRACRTPGPNAEAAP